MMMSIYTNKENKILNQDIEKFKFNKTPVHIQHVDYKHKSTISQVNLTLIINVPLANLFSHMTTSPPLLFPAQTQQNKTQHTCKHQQAYKYTHKQRHQHPPPPPPPPPPPHVHNQTVSMSVGMGWQSWPWRLDLTEMERCVDPLRISSALL